MNTQPTPRRSVIHWIKDILGDYTLWRILGNDKGMSTVEYAVGTLAAATFGATLFAVVSSGSVETALTALVEKALATTP